MGTSTSNDWRSAYERAYEASAVYRAEEERRAGQVYLFEVGFTIPSALARDARVETHGTGDGLRVEMTFLGTEDARRRITDVIAELPSTCRTFRRYYAQGSGVDE